MFVHIQFQVIVRFRNIFITVFSLVHFGAAVLWEHYLSRIDIFYEYVEKWALIILIFFEPYARNIYVFNSQ